jgi:hypothetical protein
MSARKIGPLRTRYRRPRIVWCCEKHHEHRWRWSAQFCMFLRDLLAPWPK